MAAIRPNGIVPSRLERFRCAAMIGGTVLLVVALVVAALQSGALLVVVTVYAAIQLAYCLGWKHQPVIELMSVASGFLLRAVAGGVSMNVELSQWFLTKAGFGVLFVVAGKRYAEKVLFVRTEIRSRPVLASYTDPYLRFVWTMSASVLPTATRCGCGQPSCWRAGSRPTDRDR